jgi:hypothetical protein
MSTEPDDASLHELCIRWVGWTIQHHRLARPVTPGILARMQPARLKPPPEIPLSPTLSVLNTAITAADDCPGKQAFLLFYLTADKTRDIAHLTGCTRDALYKRVRAFRRRVYLAALRMEAAQATAERRQALFESLNSTVRVYSLSG